MPIRLSKVNSVVESYNFFKCSLLISIFSGGLILYDVKKTSELESKFLMSFWVVMTPPDIVVFELAVKQKNVKIITTIIKVLFFT